MKGARPNESEKRTIAGALAAEGLERYLPALAGGTGAVQLHHVEALKAAARRDRAEFLHLLEAAGVTDAGDRVRLAALLETHLQSVGLPLKPSPAAPADSQSSGWRAGLMGEEKALPPEMAEMVGLPDDPPSDHLGEAGEVWPRGMKIVNGHLAHSIRAQGMLQEPNHYGYIHLAGEVERTVPMRQDSSSKRALLDALKRAAADLMEKEPEVRRADVFSAFLVHPGAKEGRALITRGGYDVHAAEFDVVILVECSDVDAAGRVRTGDAFLALKEILDDRAAFVHCITALNPKRIAEVDRSRDGVFLFNYFFAADIEAKGSAGVEVLLAVWEYTAGWWTAKANLTNSTPLQPIEGEHSCYSLINHCRWDRGIDIFPSLAFRPTLDRFVVHNFTANDIVSMPILYHLA